jgi:hypothetical protein
VVSVTDAYGPILGFLNRLKLVLKNDTEINRNLQKYIITSFKLRIPVFWDLVSCSLFRRNTLPPSSVLKNKRSTKDAGFVEILLTFLLSV